MEEAVKEMKYDTNKAPLGKNSLDLWNFFGRFLMNICNRLVHLLGRLFVSIGKLTKDQIKAGYSALKLIDQCISKSDFGSKLVAACDAFYTRIPHCFGWAVSCFLVTMLAFVTFLRSPLRTFDCTSFSLYLFFIRYLTAYLYRIVFASYLPPCQSMQNHLTSCQTERKHIYAYFSLFQKNAYSAAYSHKGRSQAKDRFIRSKECEKD